MQSLTVVVACLVLLSCADAAGPMANTPVRTGAPQFYLTGGILGPPTITDLGPHQYSVGYQAGTCVRWYERAPGGSWVFVDQTLASSSGGTSYHTVNVTNPYATDFDLMAWGFHDSPGECNAHLVQSERTLSVIVNGQPLTYPIAAQIDGRDVFYAGDSPGTYTWEAMPSGGNGSYTYQWYVIYTDIYPYQPEALGTSKTQSLSVNGAIGDFYLNVVVQSAGKSGSGWKMVCNFIPPNPVDCT